jgi:hypothetical protein
MSSEEPNAQLQQAAPRNEPEAGTFGPLAVYWTDEDVLAGKLVYMQSGRIARLYRIDPDGRRIFITPKGQLLCEHGERPSTILGWISAEAHAGGDARPRTTTCCTCLNTDGLHHTKSMPMPAPEELPPEPESLFSFLEQLGTEKITVKGRISLHVPHTIGRQRMFLTQRGGQLVCAHAHTREILSKIKKARDTGATAMRLRGPMCDCEFSSLASRKAVRGLPKMAMLPGRRGATR